MYKKFETFWNIVSLVIAIFFGIVFATGSVALWIYMFMHINYGNIVSICCIEIFTMSISYALISCSKEVLEDEFSITFKKSSTSTKKTY